MVLGTSPQISDNFRRKSVSCEKTELASTVLYIIPVMSWRPLQVGAVGRHQTSSTHRQTLTNERVLSQSHQCELLCMCLKRYY